MSVDEVDLGYLRRAVGLARQALEHGDQPFGSVLVAASGEVLFEDHNHVARLEATQHPEFAIARWAGGNLTAQQRGEATVYTSGEHCAMCSAAHGWVGLGRIVYAVSSAQLTAWTKEWGGAASPVAALPIEQVLPGAVVDGPVPELEAEVRALYEASARRA